MLEYDFNPCNQNIFIYLDADFFLKVFAEVSIK